VAAEPKKSAGRVLVADDDAGVLRPIAAALQLAGFEVDTASDGFQAREAINRERYDVVLTDIHMPGNEQLQLLGDPEGNVARPPIILFTGFPEFETAVTALRLGAVDYLTKPIHPEVVIERVKRVIARQRAFLELAPWIVRGRGSDDARDPVGPSRDPDRASGQASGDADPRFPGMTEAELGCLSPRERQVLQILAAGYPVQEAADRLSIAKNTARNHVKSIFTKLGVSSHAELIARVAGFRR